MVCISTVYRFTVFIYFNLEFSCEKNQGQGCYEGNVRSVVRFSEVHFLLYFLGDYLFNIIVIPSNISDADFAPCTILHVHVRTIKGKPRYKLNRDSKEVSEEYILVNEYISSHITQFNIFYIV
jgi:hypothetical protein